MRIALAAGLVLATAGTALASPDAQSEGFGRRMRPAPVGRDQTPFLIVEEGAARPPPTVEEVSRHRRYPPWVRRHLEHGRRWTDPFLVPELYPELSAGNTGRPAWDRSDRRLALEDVLALNLYLLDVRFPSTFSDGRRTRAFPSADLELRVPVPFGPEGMHRLVAFFGALVPLRGGAVEENSGAHMLLAYGLSAGPFSAQAFGGFAVEPDRFRGGPRRNIARYGGALGLLLGDHVQLSAEADVRNPRGSGYELRLAPGAHFWPMDLPTVQVGLAGLVGFVKDGDFETDELGGFFELSYNFL